MPAKSDFTAQPEVGVLGLRDSRRSGSVLSRSNTNTFRTKGASNAVRSARGVNSENTNPNLMPGGTVTNNRRSPRLSATCSGSNKIYAYASNRQTGALGDITNVVGPKPGHIDKAKSFRQPPPPAQQPQEAPPASMEISAAEERSGSKTFEDFEDLVQMRPNVQNAAEYHVDFYNNLFREESMFLPRPDYMDAQSDISPKMRTILIDWLIEVHMKYRLRSETLHLTINLIDRYLTHRPVLRKRLQLVGVVAMFIASKFEEISPPELHDWVYITDNAYSKEDVLVMECNMLSTLCFQVMVPTAAHFFEGLAKVNCCDGTHRNLVNYILELGLLDIRMLQHIPSHAVAAAFLLSNELLGRSPAWPPIMVQHSRHTELSLRRCAEDLRQLVQAERSGGSQLQAVRKKFSVPQRHSVAEMSF